MNFGVPKKNKKREEKYPNTAVFTLIEEGPKGTAKTMVFNTKACELLGLPEKKAVIAFVFEGGIKIMNANQTGIPEEHAINVTKTAPRRISDKKTYEYIAELLSLNTTIENEFELVNESETDGVVHFNITPLKVVDEAEEVEEVEKVETEAVEEAVEDEIFDFEQEVTNTSEV